MIQRGCPCINAPAKWCFPRADMTAQNAHTAPLEHGWAALLEHGWLEQHGLYHDGCQALAGSIWPSCLTSCPLACLLPACLPTAYLPHLTWEVAHSPGRVPVKQL